MSGFASDGPTTAAERLSVPARRQRLVAEIEKQLRLRCGFEGGKMLIGVSGGPDSLALLLGCVALRDRAALGQTGGHAGRQTGGQTGGRTGFTPIAAYVHHHLRAAADEDAEHVGRICRRFDVQLHVQHIHPSAEGGNLAADARRLRYEAMQSVAERVGASHVAVGHHSEDQLETMLMALCRGAGLEGFSGMAWRRPLADGIWLIRPLLAMRKADCHAMCESAEITWREDPTNRDPETIRGRVRREIMPVLDVLWPDACRRSAGTADLITAAAELMEHRAQEVFGDRSQRQWDRAHLARQSLAVIATGLRRAAIDEIGEASDDLGQRHLTPAAEAVIDGERRPRRYGLPGGLAVHVRSRSVDLVRE